MPGSLMDESKGVIGWKEKIDLPEWGISGLIAKSDTGARSSAIDVAQIEERPDGRVRFAVRLRRKPEEVLQWVEAEVSRQTHVRSSIGVKTHRTLVKTSLQIGSVTRDVEFSLVCRKKMLCRALLGRSALDGVFLVDSGRKYVLTGKRRKKKK